MKVAFFSYKNYDKESFDKHNKAEFGGKFQFTYYSEYLNMQNVHLAKGHEAVCVFVNDPVDAQVIEELSKLGVKAIVLRCAGFDRVALDKAKEKGIAVMRVPAYSPESVAEQAVSLLMTVNRHLHVAYKRVSDNNFSIDNLQGVQLFGKTAGVMGTGRIGQCAIKIFKGLGMNVVGYDVFRNDKAAAELGFTYVDTPEELYKQSDVITLHVFASKENTHMINKQTLSQMKNGVFLLNVSRGSLVDTAALLDAIKAGKVRGAGLDVYENEGGLFFDDHSSNKTLDDPLLARLQAEPRVVLTAHQAFLTDEALDTIAQVTMGNLVSFFEKGEATNVAG